VRVRVCVRVREGRMVAAAALSLVMILDRLLLIYTAAYRCFLSLFRLLFFFARAGV